MSYITSELVTGRFTTCAKCGLLFGLTSEYEERRREDHKGFYCPNGHSLIFGGENATAKIARLENEKKLEQEKRVRAENDAKIFREEALKEAEKNKKLRKKALRVKKGCCPECNRSFVNLQRHMVTKHVKGCKSEKGYKIKSRMLP